MHKDMMIKFCSPLIPDMKNVHNYLIPSFNTGHLSNFGQAYQSLCGRLHKYFNLRDDRDIVIVSSGHMALQASYQVLGIKKPAITDYTFRSTLLASFEQPIIIDCDHNGFLNLETNDNYDAAVLVCPLSRIPDIKYYEEKCKEKNIPLIIDGAATFGTTDIYNYGDCFCLSFHATKTFSIGECGAVICSKELAIKIKQYINFGFDEKRNPIMSGTNAKVSEYTCAIGLDILDNIEQDYGPISKRIKNSHIYLEKLNSLILPTFAKNTVYQSFPIYFKDKEYAEVVRKKLKENGVEFLQYYRPLTNLPNAKFLYENNICLPCHQDVTEKQIEDICNIILK